MYYIQVTMTGGLGTLLHSSLLCNPVVCSFQMDSHRHKEVGQSAVSLPSGQASI